MNSVSLYQEGIFLLRFCSSDGFGLWVARTWRHLQTSLEDPATRDDPQSVTWAWSQYCPQTVLRLASRELNCSQHHLWIVLSDWVMIPGETLVSFTPRIYLPILLKTLHCWGCLYLGFKANFLPLNSYMYWCIDDGGHNIEMWLIHVHHRFLLLQILRLHTEQKRGLGNLWGAWADSSCFQSAVRDAGWRRNRWGQRPGTQHESLVPAGS